MYAAFHVSSSTFRGRLVRVRGTGKCSTVQVSHILKARFRQRSTTFSTSLVASVHDHLNLTCLALPRSQVYTQLHTHTRHFAQVARRLSEKCRVGGGRASASGKSAPVCMQKMHACTWHASPALHWRPGQARPGSTRRGLSLYAERQSVERSCWSMGQQRDAVRSHSLTQ